MKKEMYNPCLECLNRYGREYTKKCDDMCEYAHAVSKLKPYGGIDEVVKVMKGESFPLVLVDDKHIDFTYKLVCAVKDGVI